jgi:hypothetical protein
MLPPRKNEDLGSNPRLRIIGSQAASVFLHLAVSAFLLLDFGGVLESPPAGPGFDPKKVVRVFVPALGSPDSAGGDLAEKRTRAEQKRGQNPLALRKPAFGPTAGARIKLAGFQLFVRSDSDQELPAVLGAYKGSLGFGSCDDPLVVRRMASAPDWRLAQEENPVSLDAFFALRILSPQVYTEWKRATEKAQSQSLDCVYALFPIAVERVLLQLILTEAAARNGASTIQAADVAVASSVPAGFRVENLNAQPTGVQTVRLPPE